MPKWDTHGRKLCGSDLCGSSNKTAPSLARISGYCDSRANTFRSSAASRCAVSVTKTLPCDELLPVCFSHVLTSWCRGVNTARGSVARSRGCSNISRYCRCRTRRRWASAIVAKAASCLSVLELGADARADATTVVVECTACRCAVG